MEEINLLTIATIALLGSLGHCIGMCGGIVIAYTTAKVDRQWSKTRQAAGHLIYSLGRTLTYVIFGAMFGYLGSVVTFSAFGNGVLLMFAGVVMLLTGLSLLGKIKFLTLIEPSLSKFGWYQRSFRSLIGQKSLFSFFLLGMLNGLLPCGFVYFFAVTAASTTSAFWGAVVMLVFGLSTIPALFSFGFFVGLFQHFNFRGLMVKLASIMVIGYGLFTLYNGYQFVIDPDRLILQCH
jgi:sulfite exporter TauE/SafE